MQTPALLSTPLRRIISRICIAASVVAAGFPVKNSHSGSVAD
jgi:hypothetical protein